MSYFKGNKIDDMAERDLDGIMFAWKTNRLNGVIYVVLFTFGKDSIENSQI